MISVQEADFDHCKEYEALRNEADGDGAVVTFTGLVRDFNISGSVSAIHIEHYPGMTEKSLVSICSEARNRWELGQIRVIHRVGTIEPKGQIVFVGVTSRHRKNAFEACEFIIDYLKTAAPLWKQEGTNQGMKWVESKVSDQEAINSWFENSR